MYKQINKNGFNYFLKYLNAVESLPLTKETIDERIKIYLALNKVFDKIKKNKKQHKEIK